MNPNDYIKLGNLVTSCVVSSNVYSVLSEEEEFPFNPLEEMTDTIRQTVGRSYMRASIVGTKADEVWMVPFVMHPQMLPSLQRAMEYVFCNCLGMRELIFPFDVVLEDGQTAYLLHPINRGKYVPIRKFLPDALAERWLISKSLFTRVQQLKDMGLTSNGFSREQVRVCVQTNEVHLWLNESLSLQKDSAPYGALQRHQGFLSLPQATEDRLAEQGIEINGTQRDIFSAAVLAFYLIMYTHPFVGSAFNSLLRDDYMTQYMNYPEYILMKDGSNNLGNQVFGRVVQEQWNRTVPELRALFDGLFAAVSDPGRHWDANASYWDPMQWLSALALDADRNDNETSHSDFHFINEQYHQV